MAKCGKIISQDQSDRCELEPDHDGPCGWLPLPYTLHVKEYIAQTTVYQADPRMRSVSKGDGLYWAVPVWVADKLQELEALKARLPEGFPTKPA